MTHAYKEHPEPVTWKPPAEWKGEESEIVSLDLVLDAGVHFDWADDPTYFDLIFGSFGRCTPKAEFGLIALVMRARVRLWWHVRRMQIQIAILGNDL